MKIKANLLIPIANWRLRTIFAPMKILMVCLGNICRSPLAEGILQQKAAQAGLDWQVDSAGTNGYHIGEAPHRLSQKVALQHGIDISGQRSRKFKPEDFSSYDLIYVMAADVATEMMRIAGDNFVPEKVKLLMNEVYPDQNMDVPDPWYGPEKGYHEVYDMIDKACRNIVLTYAKMPEKPPSAWSNWDLEGPDNLIGLFLRD